jgi:Tol biopolymer transport system component
MALRRLGVLVVAAVVGLVVGVPPALGTESSGEEGRIAFVSQRRDGNDLDVWWMRPDGSHLVNLTPDSEADEWEPSWRPDGRKLAFISNRVTPTNPGPDPDFEIFVMNADGSGVRQLTVNNVVDEAPNWSPDGRRLVFHRNLDPKVPQADYGHGNYEVFTMQADGTHQRDLTNLPGSQELFPDWSPDGRRIAFDSNRDGDREIYTMRPDGSRVQQLTFNGDRIDDGFPAWSPDGRRIAFNSGFTPGPHDVSHWEIYTMRADGRDQTRLTFQTADFQPRWSPDGRKLVFTSFREATPPLFENSESYTMRADGSQQVNRSRHPEPDFDPDWGPLPKHHH